jgi:hypothetical protein
MITQETIKMNLDEIRAAMSFSAHRAGRNIQDIRLMAVTKLKPADVIQSLIDLGIKDIGENYPDETMTKIEVFPERSGRRQTAYDRTLSKQKSQACCGILRFFSIIGSVGYWFKTKFNFRKKREKNACTFVIKYRRRSK